MRPILDCPSHRFQVHIVEPNGAKETAAIPQYAANCGAIATNERNILLCCTILVANARPVPATIDYICALSSDVCGFCNVW